MDTVSLFQLPIRYKAVLLMGIIALGICGVSAINGNDGYRHLQELRLQQELEEAKVYRFENENQGLREHIHRLESDDAYLEKVVRERLGWVKPGDVIYRNPAGGNRG